MHDVSFIEHPEYFTATRRSQLRLTVGRTVKRAARILTVSEFSRDAILRAYDIPPEKIRVIPNAANPEFRVVGRERAQKAVQGSFAFRSPLHFFGRRSAAAQESNRPDCRLLRNCSLTVRS